MIMQDRKQRFDFTPEQREAFAKLFKEARQRKGETQDVVAQKSGLPRTTVGMLERDAWPGMNLVDVRRLAVYYGIDMETVYKILGI